MTAATPVAGGVGPNSHAYTNIATNTTTVVKASEGTLHRVVLNKRVAAGVITMYDHPSAASGNKIGTITNAGTILSDAPASVDYGVHFKLGLTIVTSAADDITVVWD